MAAHPSYGYVQGHGRCHSYVEGLWTVIPHGDPCRRADAVWQPSALATQAEHRRWVDLDLVDRPLGRWVQADRVPPWHAARRRLREHGPHARPHRLRGVRIGAVRTEHDGAVREGVRRADHRAHVAGVV